MKHLVIFVVVAILSACGGGGGGSSSSNNSSPANTNQSPSANAGVDLSVSMGSTVILSGSGVDADGTISTYLWTLISGPSLVIDDGSSATASFLAPNVTVDTMLVFQLSVTDNDGATATDNTTVTILASNAQSNPQAYFDDNVSTIVQNQCIQCHVNGGVSGSSRLVFVPASNSNHLTTNFSAFDAFVTNQEQGDIVLSKVQGLLAHGGGLQISSNSSEFSLLSAFIDLLVSNDANTPIDPEPEPETALALFTSTISEPIVQSKCISCHVSDGIADGGVASSRLIFVPKSNSNHLTTNHDSIVNLLAEVDVGTDYILSKVVGELGHNGGQQLVSGSDDYVALANYLSLIVGEGSASNVDFWQGAKFADNQDTMRRAALILAGRLPTDVENNAVNSNSSSGLRNGVIGLMSGDNFHQFLIESSNDRLLTLKYLETHPDFLDANNGHLPELAKQHYAANEAEGDVRKAFRLKHQRARKGFAKAPLELIAYVIENDLPYSTILTADFTMVNPSLADFYRADVSFSDDASPYEFKKAKQQGYMLYDAGTDMEYIQNLGLNIITEGSILSWPHAGILNDPAFLSRYPSTATNRNRARARWTFFHFLNFDIEKSSARTTDPDALADTDNPTMNNPACTVCHIPMDPVAGAFQNYGDTGYYRDQWGGKDSLPRTYKKSAEEGYQDGDTWYRTMREPGFNQQLAPNNNNSLQWLAEQIVNDDRFSIATVKFWWPSVMGTQVASLPANVNDADYAARKLVFDQQDAFINQVANSFQQHQNLKQLLADLITSSWFRLASVEEAYQHNHKANKNGFGQLLTPEQLDRKTLAITGLSWGEHYPNWYDNQRYSYLMNDYRLVYGGIDSDGINVRATDMTSIMAQVALTHASELACPIVMEEFFKADEERKLFAGITRTTLPDDELVIRNKLVELHQKLLGERLEVNDEEINHSLFLVMQVREQNLARNDWQHIMDQNLTCNVDWDDYKVGNISGWEHGNDPEAMLSAWQAVLVYLMSDFRYLHE